MTEPMPRLSESLGHQRAYGICQSCGKNCGVGIQCWQEHDLHDKPEMIVVCLCDDCARREIKPHPRLYRMLRGGEPFPGAMPCCLGCKHSRGMTCLHPDLKANGGQGLPLHFPQPDEIFLDGRDPKTGKRWGYIHKMYRGPVECKGKDS